MIHHFPLEVSIEILAFMTPHSALKMERCCRLIREISLEYESRIWKPKFLLLLNNDSVAPLAHESFRILFRLYLGWSLFPHLKQEHLSLCLDPSELSLSPLSTSRVCLSNGSMLTPKRMLLAARIGLGSTTLPVCLKDEFQLWLDNSGQITRGIVIKNGIEKSIIPKNRPLGSRIDMVSQVRSSLLSCIEYVREREYSVVYVWDPFLYQNGPWKSTLTSPSSTPSQGVGVWKFDHQYLHAKPILCGNNLLVCTSSSSCRLYSLNPSQPFNIIWDLGLSLDQLEIHQMAMNERFVILSIRNLENDSYHLLNLSIDTGQIVKRMLIPPTLSHSSFHISLTRFHVLIYNSENLCILNVKTESSQNLRLPFMGKPVRLDVAHDDSLVVIAPKYQRGEIMILDILNCKIKILTLSDGYAEGPSQRSGGNVGRMSGIWLIYSDNMMNDKGIMKERQIKVAWKKLM